MSRTAGIGQETKTTRCAQTLSAFSPVSVALLGHATRPGEPSVGGWANSYGSNKASQFIAESTHGPDSRHRSAFKK